MRASFVHGIRFRLVMAALVLLAIPWLAAQFISRMESFLRDSPEQAIGATARAVACSWESRRNDSMREMNCAASHGIARSTNAAITSRKRMPWMKLALMAALERDVDRERTEAMRRSLRVELLGVLHQVQGERAPARQPRDAHREAIGPAPVLEVGTEGIVVARDELVAEDLALAHAGVGAPGVRASRRE